MRMIVLACLIALAVQAPALGEDAAPTLKLPAEIKAAPAAISEVKAETTGKVVEWVLLTPGLSIRPTDGGKLLLFSGPVGRYELLAYTAAGDVPSKPARCVVVIESPEPPPPPKPKPDDKLRKKLADALATERAAAKADILQLAAVYREAAKVTLSGDFKTTNDLLAKLREVSAALLGTDTLSVVRATVAAELLAVLGMSGDDPLSGPQRDRAAALFAQLAATLEELAK